MLRLGVAEWPAFGFGVWEDPGLSPACCYNQTIFSLSLSGLRPTCCPDEHLSTQTLAKLSRASSGAPESSMNQAKMAPLTGLGQTRPHHESLQAQQYEKYINK